MPKSAGSHENLVRHDEIEGSSDRAFGVVFTVVFLLVGLYPLLRSEGVRVWALGLAAIILIAALARPGVLAPLNRLWLKLGLLLHRVVSPVVLGLLFYGIVLPTGLAMRLVGKRTIPVDFDRQRDTYWIERDPPGPAAEGMKNQF